MNSELKVILDILVALVVWIIVPSIMIGLLALGDWASRRPEEGDLRTSARAGFWAGLVCFVIFFAATLKHAGVPTDWVRDLSIEPLAIVSGLVGGFALFQALARFVRTRAMGFLVLVISFCGTTSLYSYVFLRGYSETILSATLGVALGLLLHVVILPGVLRELFRSNPAAPSVEDREAEP
ncbi:MAG: hypothetical protein KC609_24720 [Myxococcales bacterium]|nr:hypothetical protein [Myxococcales bacterium]